MKTYDSSAGWLLKYDGGVVSLLGGVKELE
jgi:hypothetical protein